MNGYASAKQAYTEAAVLTATPERLVVMLFDGANSFLARTAAALRASDPAVAMRNAQRAIAIIDELNFSLDMSYGEVPERLRAIYLFHKRALVEAVIARDAEAVDTVAALRRERAAPYTQSADGRGAAVADGAVAAGT
jgi:flagellar protein FliS